MKQLKSSLAFGWCAVAVLVLSSAPSVAARDVRVEPELSYRVSDSSLDTERCRLDLYLPADDTGFASLVWLHGGGLTGGSKSTETGKRIARRLAESGIAVAMVEYRLNPVATFPAYVEDAAEAFAWVRREISHHGGDPARVFLGGHSAGAYLALMVALDKPYLAAVGLEESAVAGVVAVSGQTSTHFTVRAERGLGERLIVDDAAPLFHVRKSRVPFLILYADDDLALRVEENRLLASALRHAGCDLVVDRLVTGRDHGTIYSRMHEPEDEVAKDVIRFVGEAHRTTGETL